MATNSYSDISYASNSFRNEQELRNKVYISMRLLKQINESTVGNAQIFAILDELLSYVIGSGIEITYEKLGVKSEMSDEMKHVTDTEILDWLRDYIKYQLLYGFCVYTVRESDRLPGLPIPNHPRFGDWQVMFGYDDNDVRRYRILRLDTDGGKIHSNSNRDRGRSFLNPAAGDVEEIFEGAFISVVYPPDDSGRLTSPLASILGDLLKLSNFWKDIEIANTTLARPEFIVESTSGRNGYGNSINNSSSNALDPPNITRYSNNDVLTQRQQFQNLQDQNDRQALRLATMAAELSNHGLSVVVDKKTQLVKNQELGKSSQSPVKLPVGMTIARPIQPTILNSINDLMDRIITSITSVFGNLKSAHLQSRGKMHAANTELDLRNLNDRIKWLQSRLTPKLIEVFENVFFFDLESEKNNAVNEVKDMMVVNEHQFDFYNQQLLIEHQKEFMRQKALRELYHKDSADVSVDRNGFVLPPFSKFYGKNDNKNNSQFNQEGDLKNGDKSITKESLIVYPKGKANQGFYQPSGRPIKNNQVDHFNKYEFSSFNDLDRRILMKTMNNQMNQFNFKGLNSNKQMNNIKGNKNTSDFITKLISNRRITPRDENSIRDTVKLLVSFNYTPLTSFEQLDKLSEKAFISDDYYSELALKITGIDPDKALSKREREKLLEDRIKREVKHQMMLAKVHQNNDKENGNNKEDNNNNNNNDKYNDGESDPNNDNLMNNKRKRDDDMNDDTDSNPSKRKKPNEMKDVESKNKNLKKDANERVKNSLSKKKK